MGSYNLQYREYYNNIKRDRAHNNTTPFSLFNFNSSYILNKITIQLFLVLLLMTFILTSKISSNPNIKKTKNVFDTYMTQNYDFKGTISKIKNYDYKGLISKIKNYDYQSITFNSLVLKLENCEKNLSEWLSENLRWNYGDENK